MPGLAQPRDGLDPTEDLFDSLALALADRVASVPGRAFINGAVAPLMLVLRHVRSHRRFPQFPHEILRVVILVSAQRHTLAPTWNPRGHVEPRIALGCSRGPREPRVHHQPVAILHQYMPQVTQLGFAPARFPIQHRLWIGSGLVRLIPAFLPVKVHRWIAAAVLWRWRRLVSSLKTLLPRPGFDQGSVHGEVLLR